MENVAHVIKLVKNVIVVQHQIVTTCASNYTYNGVKCVPCDKTCASCFGTVSNQCLSCYSGSYLYPDNTCVNYCSSPSVQNNINYCPEGCPMAKFLYYNSSCLGVCLPPFTNKTVNSLNYCIYPCDSSLYLNWDDTCVGPMYKPLPTRYQGRRKILQLSLPKESILIFR